MKCSYCQSTETEPIDCPECGSQHALHACAEHLGSDKCPQRRSGLGKYGAVERYQKNFSKLALGPKTASKLGKQLLTLIGDCEYGSVLWVELPLTAEYPIKLCEQEPVFSEQMARIQPAIDVNYYGETFHQCAALTLLGYHSVWVDAWVTFSPTMDVPDYAKLLRKIHFYRISLNVNATVCVVHRRWYRPAALHEETGEQFRLDHSPGKATKAVAEACQKFGGANVVRFLRQKWFVHLNKFSKGQVDEVLNPLLANLKELDPPEVSSAFSLSDLDSRPKWRVLLVARQNKVKPHLNLSPPVMRQIVSLCRQLGFTVVHFGSRVTGYTYPSVSNENEIVDFIEHFVDPTFQSSDAYQRDLYFLDRLRKELRLIAALGPKSGQIHGMCLIGLPVMDFEHEDDPALPRMFQWAEEKGGFPGFERLVTSSYLDPQAEPWSPPKYGNVQLDYGQLGRRDEREAEVNDPIALQKVYEDSDEEYEDLMESYEVHPPQKKLVLTEEELAILEKYLLKCELCEGNPCKLANED